MDKSFLTYNQQMKYLRDKKSIICSGSSDKTILCRAGYFNLVNGYKMPFVTGRDNQGHHIYLNGTSIQHLNYVKEFDDDLRSLLLKYITKAEEEVRTFSGYKFDEVNKKGALKWYQVDAFNVLREPTDIVAFISKAYGEISKSQLDYVKFYMNTHKEIPTWVLVKVINFSTFIDFLDYSKLSVKDSLCELYSIKDNRGYNNHKLLVGSLHWMRKVRNVCAHNERVFTVCRDKGRNYDNYFALLPKSYKREHSQKLVDLLIYLKYYLETEDYRNLIVKIKSMLQELDSHISTQSFEYVRAHMGIKDLSHLDILLSNNKVIDYNGF